MANIRWYRLGSCAGAETAHSIYSNFQRPFRPSSWPTSWPTNSSKRSPEQKKPGEIQEKSPDYNKLHRMKTVLCWHLRYFWHTFPCLHSKNWDMSGDVGGNSWFRSRAPIYAIQTKVTSTAVLSTNKDVPTSWWCLKQSSSRKNGPKAKQTETRSAWKCLPDPFSHNHYHRSARNHPKWKETKNWRDPFSTSRNYWRKGRLNPSKVIFPPMMKRCLSETNRSHWGDIKTARPAKAMGLLLV